MSNHFFFRLILLGSLIISLQLNIFSQNKKQKPPTTRILFVFDASYSMSGYWESKKKITLARNTLISLIDSLEKIDHVQMALRVYGHQSPVPPQDCNDTKLEVSFSNTNAPAIRQKLRFISPKGTTPLAYSLEKAGGDFPKNCPDCRNVIILITDGVEECGGDPCAISEKLQQQGIVLKPFVIGIGIDESFKQSFDCIGTFFNATNQEQFAEALNIVISHVLNQTSVQVNLLDKFGKPTETNVNMTFYDSRSGKVKHNYIHTLNNRGVPDTISLDPLLTYDMRVNTLPPVMVKNIEVAEGKHSIISADCPQGDLVIKTKSISQYKGLKVTVKQNGKKEVLNFQDVNKPERYLIGKYDINVPTLPPLFLNDVEIKQSYTTTVDIPRPGIANILLSAPGFGSLYVLRESGDWEWVYNINPSGKSDALNLLPGKYMIAFRPQNAKQTIYTSIKRFEIKSGSSVSVNFN